VTGNPTPAAAILCYGCVLRPLRLGDGAEAWPDPARVDAALVFVSHAAV
jgi:hypothetical protein